MTKRPEIIDYLLANGTGLPQAPRAVAVPAASGVCAGSHSVFDQAIDFDFPDEEQECCRSKAQHDVHVKTITQAAKAICAGCPIAQSCAAWAIANNEPGIWGGLTMTERKQRFGVAAITLEKAAELLEEYKFLESAPVEAICRKYDAVPRSVARWRKTLRSQLGLAA
jgi:hypothetical protein